MRLGGKRALAGVAVLVILVPVSIAIAQSSGDKGSPHPAGPVTAVDDGDKGTPLSEVPASKLGEMNSLGVPLAECPEVMKFLEGLDPSAVPGGYVPGPDDRWVADPSDTTDSGCPKVSELEHRLEQARER